MSSRHKGIKHTPLKDKVAQRKYRISHVSKDTLRNKFKIAAYIIQLEKIDKHLADIFKTASDPDLSSEDIARINVQLNVIASRKDLNFKRIAKVLGDVRAVELTDGDGDNVFGNMAAAFSIALKNDPLKGK